MDKDKALEVRRVEVSPAEVVETATAQAKLLMTIVKQTKCYQEISGKMYLQVEAWETIGAFNRTHAETENIEPIVKDDKTIGYRAHVQLWKDGIVVGGAIMPCYFTENCCKGKEGDAKHKACMSAAQTFATSKAYRMNFSYVAILAGFQALPAEEITEDMKPVDKTQHWCKDHDTAFFKKGKMKSYAHPIKDAEGNDTGEWCYEHTKKEPDTEQAKKDKEELFQPDPQHAAEVAVKDFDPDVLLDSLKQVKWTDATVKSYLKNVYQVDTEGTIIEIVTWLTREQREAFFKEIQDRLEMM